MSAKSDPKGKPKRGVLICISGEMKQEIVKLRRDATIFGREKGDIKIKDSEISSTHCQIQNIDGNYHIFDMNSSNGTFINDEQVVKAKLKDGDIVKLGQTQFRFTLEDEKKVRHIPTLFKTPSTSADSTNSLVNTLIDRELSTSQHIYMTLHVTYGNGKKETININQRQIFIGRASSFGLFDQDPELSRKHLLVKLNETGEIFIEDQKSTNGSFLNGKKIHGMHIISDKDIIKVGLSTIHIKRKHHSD